MIQPEDFSARIWAKDGERVVTIDTPNLTPRKALTLSLGRAPDPAMLATQAAYAFARDQGCSEDPVAIEAYEQAIEGCVRAELERLEAAAPLGSLLTVREAASRLKLHPETIRRWIKLGQVSAVSLGSDRAGYRIPSSEIDRLLVTP